VFIARMRGGIDPDTHFFTFSHWAERRQSIMAPCAAAESTKITRSLANLHTVKILGQECIRNQKLFPLKYRS
jgi:hypothetical protein